jgi:hypothetical protein
MRWLAKTNRAYLRHRLIQTLGKESEDPSCLSIHRDELYSRRFRLLTGNICSGVRDSP